MPPMAPCPVCGRPVRAEQYILTLRRKDDGKQHVCRYVLFCVDDGARWKWEDRPSDPWTEDSWLTDILTKQLGRGEVAQ